MSNGKPKGRFYAGVRWGLATPTVILVGLNLERLVVVHEYYQEGARIPTALEAARAINARYAPRKWFCGQPEPRLLDRFRRAGLRTAAVEDEEVAGINLIAEMLRRERDKEPGGLLVLPECKNLLIEFQRFSSRPRDPQKPFKDKPEQTFNFALDALRYMVLGLSYEPVLRVRWI